MLYIMPNQWNSSKSKGFHFIWASERNGFMQLYLYFYDLELNKGFCLNKGNPVSEGSDWVVER